MAVVAIVWAGIEVPLMAWSWSTVVGCRSLVVGQLFVSGVAEPSKATSTDIALALDAKYAADLSEGKAQVAMLWPGADWQAMGLRAAIVAPRARFALSGLSAILVARDRSA